MTPDQIDALLTGLFPRTVAATQQGGGFPRRVLAGTLDAASMPGRAWMALADAQNDTRAPTVAQILADHSLKQKPTYLQSMAQTQMDPSLPLAERIGGNMFRDPTSILAPGVGEAVASGGARLVGSLGRGVLGRVLAGGADAAAQTGLQAANQLGTSGSVDPRSLALTAGLMGAGSGIGAGVSSVAPRARAAILDNPNFQKWFGRSKVVDEAGNPLVVYHGTGGDFEQFNTAGGTGKTFGSGSFFSSSPDVANTYATGSAQNVMPSYLAMDNPAVFDANGARWNRMGKSVKASLPKTTVSGQEDENLYAALAGIEPKQGVTKTISAKNTTLGKLFPGEFQWGDETFSTDDLARWAKQQGHGGVIIKNVIDHGPSGQFASDVARTPTDIYVPFNATQIKSATGNRGTFDPTDPNITHLVGGGTQIPVAQPPYPLNALAGKYLRGYFNASPDKENQP